MYNFQGQKLWFKLPKPGSMVKIWCPLYILRTVMIPVYTWHVYKPTPEGVPLFMLNFLGQRSGSTTFTTCFSQRDPQRWLPSKWCLVNFYVNSCLTFIVDIQLSNCILVDMICWVSTSYSSSHFIYNISYLNKDVCTLMVHKMQLTCLYSSCEDLRFLNLYVHQTRSNINIVIARDVICSNVESYDTTKADLTRMAEFDHLPKWR